MGSWYDSNLSKITTFESGGLYQVVTKKGLDFGFLISTVKISKSLWAKSFMKTEQFLLTVKSSHFSQLNCTNLTRNQKKTSLEFRCDLLYKWLKKLWTYPSNVEVQFAFEQAAGWVAKKDSSASQHRPSSRRPTLSSPSSLALLMNPLRYVFSLGHTDHFCLSKLDHQSATLQIWLAAGLNNSSVMIT